MPNQHGAASRGALWLVALLVLVLIVVLVLWQRDRESKDLEIDIGLSAPALIGPDHWKPPAA
jgi:hypothetical protein